jgi:uncharacterized protein YndB with AHSA1/START domain
METITVKVNIEASLQKVWNCFTNPSDVMCWNSAVESWHTPSATNVLKVGGKFNYRMEAKDGSMGFDFWGIYTTIIPLKRLAYTLGDGRKVTVDFNEKKNRTEVVESFETESENTIENQRIGWQSILDNFKKYVEKPH